MYMYVKVTIDAFSVIINLLWVQFGYVLPLQLDEYLLLSTHTKVWDNKFKYTEYTCSTIVGHTLQSKGFKSIVIIFLFN